MTYSMTCTCGHVMSVDATSREKAVEEFKGMMTEEAIAQHIKDKHSPDEPVPTQDQVYAMIEQTTQEAAAAAA